MWWYELDSEYLVYVCKQLWGFSCTVVVVDLVLYHSCVQRDLRSTIVLTWQWRDVISEKWEVCNGVGFTLVRNFVSFKIISLGLNSVLTVLIDRTLGGAKSTRHLWKSPWIFTSGQIFLEIRRCKLCNEDLIIIDGWV